MLVFKNDFQLAGDDSLSGLRHFAQNSFSFLTWMTAGGHQEELAVRME